MTEETMANKLKQGDTVLLDGVAFKVKARPFGSGRVVDGVLVSEEVTLTLSREQVVDEAAAAGRRIRQRWYAERGIAREEES